MRYWKVSLLHEGRTAREWHVGAEVLTVGSHGSNKVRLPPPVAPFALRMDDLTGPVEVQVESFLLRIEDETTVRESLWNRAQQRLEQVEMASEVIPPLEQQSPARILVAALAMAGLTQLAAHYVGSQAGSSEHRSSASIVREIRDGATSLVEPSYEYSTTAAATPDQPRVGTHGSREHFHLASLVPSGTFHELHQNPSSDGFWIEGSLPVSGNGATALWSSTPPERYQAPWPDAPVPPH